MDCDGDEDGETQMAEEEDATAGRSGGDTEFFSYLRFSDFD